MVELFYIRYNFHTFLDCTKKQQVTLLTNIITDVAPIEPNNLLLEKNKC